MPLEKLGIVPMLPRSLLTAKSAETKAKKAEKALADANQKRVQREQAIAERLDKIFVHVGSKCRVVLFCLLAHASIC
jgi:hypothetical protein